MKNYWYGLRAEDRLAGAYARRGHLTGYYERSRGPADVTAIRGGRRLHIQVKSVRSNVIRVLDVETAFEIISRRLSEHDVSALIAHARRSGGQPAVALTNGDYYWTWRVRASRSEHVFTLLHDGWLPKRPLSREDFE